MLQGKRKFFGQICPCNDTKEKVFFCEDSAALRKKRFKHACLTEIQNIKKIFGRKAVI